MPKAPANTYLRFVVGRKHKDSGVRNGVFNDVYALLRGHELSATHRNALKRHLDWFGDKLPTPDRFNKTRSKGWFRRSTKGISWLKATAQDHVSRMWEMAGILEEYGFAVTMIKSDRPGYVVYEDEWQIVAEPFADTGV